MLLYVLSSSLTQLAVIDTWISLLWVTRYYPCGQFELILPAEDDPPAWIAPDRFITRDDDDSVMVVEGFYIQTDAENGDSYVITGRTLESLMYRRIFNRQYNLRSSGTLSFAVAAMVDECTTLHEGIAPTHPYSRKILGLTVEQSGDFPADITAQFAGETLLDGIISVCRPREIGTRMRIKDGQLLLSLYQGREVNVVFSPEYDNLISSKCGFDTTSWANNVYVFGEGEGTAKYIGKQWPYRERYSDLDLRELYVDGSSASRNNGEITIIEYGKMLFEIGKAALAEHLPSSTMEAEIEPQTTFRYKRDYHLGDIVTVDNGRGFRAKPRITEIAESWDANGYTVVPTLSELKIEETSRILLRDSEGYVLRDSTGAILTVKE